MRYRTIPGTELNASLICLGSCFFGTSIPRDDAFAVLDAFAGQGGNFVDTAHVYASWMPNGVGASERTLGAWLQARGVRKSFIVATKGGDPDLETNGPPRLAPEQITHDLLESLERLQSDYIDLYWLHRDNPRVPVDEIIDVLNQHLAAGRLRAIGASNWSVKRQLEAAAYARAHGLVSFCASEIGFSLAPVSRENSDHNVIYMDEGTLQEYIETQIPVVAFSSQAEGFFSGKYGRYLPLPDTPQAKRVASLYFCEENWDRLERAQALAAKYGRTANQIALAFLLSQPFPVYPIVGCRTVAQVLDSCAAADLALSAEEVAALAGHYHQF